MKSFLNPVYPHSCPDPFVLKYCGEYWGYCTGRAADGRLFGIVHSRDLVQWRAVGGALAELPGAWPHYWAPEVTYHNGRFYMYYSVGDELNVMQIRVAVAAHPAGPFIDSGRRLTVEPFAIDAHVFIADDGTWRLFYATDFLDRDQIGTGTVQARLRDPFTLAEPPRPVTLPRYDWHVYDPRRAEKGGVRWHTVEGPFVLERKGRYYQMFSGGNWQNLTYGVSYAISPRIDTEEEWTQAADGERVLPILRTIPGEVIGPGHNSVVRGPDNLERFCIYHRWSHDLDARVMAIDRLDWAGERLLVLGPSTTPQPAPASPVIADFFDAGEQHALGPNWACAGGHWSTQQGAAVQANAGGTATARCRRGGPYMVAEVSLRMVEAPGTGDQAVTTDDPPPATGAYGIGLGEDLWWMLEPARHVIAARVRRDDGGWHEEQLPLLPEFDPHVYHLLRLEVNGQRACLTLDDVTARWSVALPGSAGDRSFALCTRDQAAAFAGFALTLGWEDLFVEPGDDPAALGWASEQAGWQVVGGELRQSLPQDHALIVKGPHLEAYDLVVNARLLTLGTPEACYGFCPVVSGRTALPLLAVERGATGWQVRWRDSKGTNTFGLPASFDPAHHQQFRLRRDLETLHVTWEGLPLGSLPIEPGPAQIGLYVHRAVAAFDMVRLTALGRFQRKS